MDGPTKLIDHVAATVTNNGDSELERSIPLHTRTSTHFYKNCVRQVLEEFKQKEKDEATKRITPTISDHGPQAVTRLRAALPQAVEFRERTHWSQLPILGVKNEIVATIRNNLITVIKGSTGCGKSTQIPQYIAEDCRERNVPYFIAVSQPRRFAAKSLAQRVADEVQCETGDYVGYHIGLDKKRSSRDTKIVYCTTGILLQNFIMSPFAIHFTHVILDEVHERSADLDMLLLALRKRILTHKFDIKIILMSATFDDELFRKYFTIPRFSPCDSNFYDFRPALFDINQLNNADNQKTFTRETYYLEDILNKLQMKWFQFSTEHNVNASVREGNSEKAVFCLDSPCLNCKLSEVVIEVLKYGIELSQIPSLNKGTVLIFLPGLAEIINLLDCLRQNDLSEKYKWKYFILHSTVSLKEQYSVMEAPVEGFRHIILSTNIAESSLTVPKVEYVIDFCLQKSIGYSRQSGNYSQLTLKWASQSACDQRAGRTGRTNCGTVFRLVPSFFYQNFHKYDQADFDKIPLENYILKAKLIDPSLSPKEVLAFAINPPNLMDIEKSILTLKRVGALSVYSRNKTDDDDSKYSYQAEDGDLTTLGFFMSFLPLDISLSKLISLGIVFDVTFESIVMAAASSTPGIFMRKASDPLVHYKSVLSWSYRECSDLFAVLKVYRVYKTLKPMHGKAQKWCQANNIEFQRMCELETLVSEIVIRMKQFFKIDLSFNSKNIHKLEQQELILKVVIAGAFYPHYFRSESTQADEIKSSLGNINLEKTVILTGLDRNSFSNVIYMPALRQLFDPCSLNFDFKIYEKQVYMELDFQGYNLSLGNEDHPLHQPYSLHIDREHFSSTGAKLDVFKTWSSLQEIDVHMSVYLALASRRLHDSPLAVKRYNKNVEESYLKELVNEMEEKLDRRLLSNESCGIMVSGTPVKWVLPRMPIVSPSLIWMDVHISHFICARLFYCLYDHPFTERMMLNLSLLSNRVVQLVNDGQLDKAEKIAYKHYEAGDHVLYWLPVDKYPSLKCLVERYQLATSLMDGARKCLLARAQIVKQCSGESKKEENNFALFFYDYGFSEKLQLDREHCFKLNVFPPQGLQTNRALRKKYEDENELDGLSYTELCKQVLLIPALAVKCEMVRVRPIILGSSQGWSPAITTAVLDIARIYKFAFQAKIYAFYKDCLFLELHQDPQHLKSEQDRSVALSIGQARHDDDENNYELFSLNKLLVGKKLADFRIEKELCRFYQARRDLNRKQQQNSDDEKQLVFSNESDSPLQYQLDLESIKVSEDKKFCFQKVHLQGPFSPLELAFRGLTNCSSHQSTRVSSFSVNAVALETERNQHSRLLVAGCVTSNHSNDALTLDNTTLMPGIPDFASFMCLLFAPNVELRMNKMLPMRCQYMAEEICGAICGLGFDPHNFQSFDMENDIDFMFESSVNMQDIELINLLRLKMSEFYPKRPYVRVNCETFSGGVFQIDPASLAQSQAKCRQLLLGLFSRERIKRKWLYNQEYNSNPFGYRWNLCAHSTRITNADCPKLSFRTFSSRLTASIKSGLLIWPPFQVPLIPRALDDDDRERCEWEQHILANLNAIERSAFNESIAPDPALNVCKLCMVLVTSKAEMAAHIKSETCFDHKEAAYIFRHHLMLHKRDPDIDFSIDIARLYYADQDEPPSQRQEMLETNHDYAGETPHLILRRELQERFELYTLDNLKSQVVEVIRQHQALTHNVVGQWDFKTLLDNAEVNTILLEYFDMDSILLLSKYLTNIS